VLVALVEVVVLVETAWGRGAGRCVWDARIARMRDSVPALSSSARKGSRSVVRHRHNTHNATVARLAFTEVDMAAAA